MVKPLISLKETEIKRRNMLLRRSARIFYLMARLRRQFLTEGHHAQEWAIYAMHCL